MPGYFAIPVGVVCTSPSQDGEIAERSLRSLETRSASPFAFMRSTSAAAFACVDIRDEYDFGTQLT